MADGETGVARGWRFAYLFPFAAFVLAAWSAYVAIVTTLYPTNSYCASGQSCLDIGTYFWFETVIYALVALLTRRAVRRLLKGGEMSAYRVAIPVMLGAIAVVSLVAELLTISPTRGADVPVYYGLWSSWDPGVTLFRIFVVTFVAAGFVLLVGYADALRSRAQA